ncbi:MAG: hypothetical protein ABI696_04620 [Rubrivivax sp.]
MDRFRQGAGELEGQKKTAQKPPGGSSLAPGRRCGAASKTPPADMKLIERRLKAAEADYKARVAKGKK